jgi:hypothetical protein
MPASISGSVAPLPPEAEPPPVRGSTEPDTAVGERRGVAVAPETCDSGVFVGVMVGVFVGVLVRAGVFVDVKVAVGVAEGAGGVPVGVDVASDTVEVAVGVPTAV